MKDKQKSKSQMHFIKNFFVSLAAFTFWASLVLSPVYGQENLPQPIDAALVFTSPDLAEVVENLPLFIEDRLKQQINFYVYGMKQWHTYTYPILPLLSNEVTNTNFVENTASTFTLQVDYYIPCEMDCDMGEGAFDWTPPRAASVRERWHFDPKNGAFTPYESICGDHAKALVGEGEWIIYESDNSTYICNTETGQTSKALSNDFSLGITPALLNGASFSLDQQWLVFTPYFNSRVFVYDFLNEKLIHLGDLNGNGLSDRDYPLIRWVDSQRVILENEISGMGNNDYDLYQADLTHADSLELLYHSNVNGLPTRLENPLRYIWEGKQFEDMSWDAVPTMDEESCTIHIYHAAAETTESYYVPGICTYGLEIPDGTSDRLAVSASSEQTEAQTVIRFNPHTDHQENVIDLPSFGWLTGLSPSGRYVGVGLRSEGDNAYSIALLDLQTEKFVEFSYPIEGLQYKMWIDDQRFMLFFSSHAALLRIMGDKAQLVTELDVPYYRSFSPNQQLIIVNGANGTLDIFDTHTQAISTIAHIPDGYATSTNWIDNSTIDIILWSADYKQQFGRWRIRLKF